VSVDEIAGKRPKIAISGKSGCGNTTVSRLVAEAAGLRFINFTFRNLAKERGVTLAELLALAAKDDSLDLEVDRRQVKMARESGKGCVLGSRLAIWMLPEADIKVYLNAEPEERVRRIMKREGGEFEATAAFTQKRDKEDSARYLRLYKINNDDYSAADLVIDTGCLRPQEIAGMILEEGRRRGIIF
jgi:cytidylate kinase